MASFTVDAKAEISRILPSSNCCALAECYGVLLFCNSFQPGCIRIITESREFGQILAKLFRKAFGLTFDQLPEDNERGKLTYQITDPAKTEIILSTIGFQPEKTVMLHVNLPVVEEECCRRAFFRGVFLAGGSVTDPAKGYHLELTTTHQTVARECYALMEECIGFYPKASSRGGNQVLYFKKSDQISDFLAYIGAGVCSMGIIETRLEKGLKNDVNRRCNCDDANITKAIVAAQEQLSAIRILRQRGQIPQLGEKLRQAAEAREKNPEATLSELSAMMDPPITKSSMNQRLKRLVAMSKEMIP